MVLRRALVVDVTDHYYITADVIHREQLLKLDVRKSVADVGVLSYIRVAGAHAQNDAPGRNVLRYYLYSDCNPSGIDFPIKGSGI